MKPSSLLLLSLGLVAAAPAVAEPANDAPAVTVLRGASAPPATTPPVIVQTVVSPQIVYLPAYDPGYWLYPGYFYPGFFIQPQGFAHGQLRPTVRIMGTVTGRITGATSSHK
jgi:hypothetical protein